MADILKAAAQTGTRKECARIVAAALGALLYDQSEAVMATHLILVERARQMMAEESESAWAELSAEASEAIAKARHN